MPMYKYPYTDFHEVNLDYIMNLAMESMGLHLEVSGRKLNLVNAAKETISSVTISYADTALKDESGNNITAYIISAGTSGDNLVFANGAGNITTLKVPFATKASNDANGNDITSYVSNMTVSGNNLKITYGNGNSATIEVPYAVKASKDASGKEITTYAANISVSGDYLVVKDGIGNTLDNIKVPYAETAGSDKDGTPLGSYAKTLSTGERTVKLISKDGTLLSEVTVPFSTIALTDTAGNAFISDYGSSLSVEGNNVNLKSFSGKIISTITVPFASLATDATNSVSRVDVSGNTMVFTTYGGTRYEITSPYAVKATNDGGGSEITKTYVANVTRDLENDQYVFLSKDGNEIARVTSSSKTAEYDSFGNLIAAYVKEIATEEGQNYVSITHGNGTVDTLTIDYANRAWKDTYGNIIGNFYIGFLKTLNDEETGEPMLVAYNGENAELFRVAITAVSASKDGEGNVISDTYGSSLLYEDNNLSLVSKSGEVLSAVTIESGSDTTELEGRVSTLETKVGDLESSYNTLNLDITNINSNLNSLNSDMTQVKGDITSIDSDLASLTSSISDLENSVAGIDSNISSLDSSVSSLESTVNLHNTQIDQNASDINELIGKVNTLDVNIQKINDQDEYTVAMTFDSSTKTFSIDNSRSNISGYSNLVKGQSIKVTVYGSSTDTTGYTFQATIQRILSSNKIAYCEIEPYWFDSLTPRGIKMSFTLTISSTSVSMNLKSIVGNVISIRTNSSSYIRSLINWGNSLGSFMSNIVPFNSFLIEGDNGYATVIDIKESVTSNQIKFFYFDGISYSAADPRIKSLSYNINSYTWSSVDDFILEFTNNN